MLYLPCFLALGMMAYGLCTEPWDVIAIPMVYLSLSALSVLVLIRWVGQAGE